MLRPTPLHPKHDEKEDGRPTQRAGSSRLTGLAILRVRIEEMPGRTHPIECRLWTTCPGLERLGEWTSRELE